MEKSKVYFTKDVSSLGFIKLYEALGVSLQGKVAVKLHSGEHGNCNYLKPEFVKDIVEKVGGVVVECNTAYPGERDTSLKHKKLLENHGWTKYFTVDLLDEEGPDLELAIPNGLQIKKNFVGKNLANYDSMLVLSHFKGHAMGGFGGALKQLSIGCASSYGKAYIHGAGVVSQNVFATEQISFVTAMGDAASSIHNYFQGNIVYINAMVNISRDCDCDSNASLPCMKDIGLFASLDAVAIDKACVDMIYQSDDSGKDAVISRIEEKKGTIILETANQLGVGSLEYELIEI